MKQIINITKNQKHHRKKQKKKKEYSENEKITILINDNQIEQKVKS